MYEAPSVDQIVQDLRASVQSEVFGTDPWIWPNNLVPVLKALGQGMRAGYLRLEFIHEQAFVTTARRDYLDWHGIQAGGLTRNPATFASGEVTAAATLGTTVIDATQLFRADSQTYAVVGTTTATTATLRLKVRAVVAGELGNTDAGAQLTPLSPIAGVSGPFTVAAGGLIGGAQQESDESFRQRILFRKQNPPHGGSPAEYIEWAQIKSGVTRVFVKRATPGPGSVTIYFMMDNVGNGIPSAADVTDLQAVLDTYAPADANVIVAAPTAVPVNVAIADLVPNTAAMREAITSELQAMFLRKAEPASVSEPFTFSRAWIDEAISLAPKWQRSRTTAPAADVVLTAAGEIPVLGVVSF